LFRKRDHADAQSRARLRLDLEGVVVYAIGDVHGCYDALVSLERQIIDDANAFEEPKLMILLGDYIDRGGDSARVVSHLIKPPPPDFRRICLAGNHENCMLRYLDGKVPIDDWLALGGIETLYSYGLDPVYLNRLYESEPEVDAYIRDNIPPTHVEFLRGLPVMAYSDEIVFVHAGIRPGVPLQEQNEPDLTTIRSAFLDSTDRFDRWVIHGHTRVDFPRAQGKRLGVDTGAFETGRLTAFRILGRRGRLLFS
jgi:serine/threonine protein phosphatase 1